eukprot:4321028-Prymnesium_polylepis.1
MRGGQAPHSKAHEPIQRPSSNARFVSRLTRIRGSCSETSVSNVRRAPSAASEMPVKPSPLPTSRIDLPTMYCRSRAGSSQSHEISAVEAHHMDDPQVPPKARCGSLIVCTSW